MRYHITDEGHQLIDTVVTGRYPDFTTEEMKDKAEYMANALCSILDVFPDGVFTDDSLLCEEFKYVTPLMKRLLINRGSIAEDIDPNRDADEILTRANRRQDRLDNGQWWKMGLGGRPPI